DYVMSDSCYYQTNSKGPHETKMRLILFDLSQTPCGGTAKTATQFIDELNPDVAPKKINATAAKVARTTTANLKKSTTSTKSKTSVGTRKRRVETESEESEEEMEEEGEEDEEDFLGQHEEDFVRKIIEE
ncbi:hypothetical protein PENTCL1PPCAC_14590, partial [Pristionchus entomophagus]